MAGRHRPVVRGPLVEEVKVTTAELLSEGRAMRARLLRECACDPHAYQLRLVESMLAQLTRVELQKRAQQVALS